MLKVLTTPLPYPSCLSATMLLMLVLLFCATPATARGIYQEPNTFVATAFDTPVKPKALWLNEQLQSGIGKILGHPYPSLRLRYWQAQETSVWVLEEIGKERPITFGVVITGGRIERLDVLIFRESRGDEIRHPFFTRQFSQQVLTDDLMLSSHIDGISGATLSTRAAERVARLALFLHNQVTSSP